MTALLELGTAVRSRRSTMGLTQASLARLSGLSRATVNSLEQGTIKDLSLTRASNLLNVLGMKVAIAPPRARKGGHRTRALEIAARTASTSFKQSLKPKQLRKVLVSDALPVEVVPHIRALLDEAPISLLATLAEELAEEAGLEPRSVWGRMHALAYELHAARDIWQ